MTNHRASVLAAIAFLVLGTATLHAQARAFTGRLVSRELTVTTNCSPVDPPRQVLGPGLALPRPKLPECDFVFPTGGNQKTAPVFSAFNLGLPEETPTGIMNPSDSTATLDFDQPLQLSFSTSAGWLLNPPAGQTTGTHRATAGVEIDQQPGVLPACVASNTSADASGSLALAGSCSIRSSLASWDPATQSARQTISTTITFRFGNGNGVYTVLVRGAYEYRALDIDHLEVVQAVQTANNRVPLAAGKPALVRVFPAAPLGYNGGIQVKLAIYRDDRLLQTIESAAIPTNSSNPLDRTANFLLSPSVTFPGTLRLEPSIRLMGSQLYVAGKPFEATFQAAPNWPNPFTILVGGQPELSQIPLPIPGQPELSQFDAPAGRLFQVRAATGATAIAAPDGSATFACLLGSTLGLQRAPAIIGDPGLAPNFDSIIPADTADFMTCEPSVSPTWINANNAIRLFDAFRTRNTATTPATLITGTIVADGSSATIDPPLSTQTAIRLVEGGPICLRQFAKGAVSGSDQCAELTSEFAFAIPTIPADTDRIAIFNGDRELASLTRSPNAPAIQIANKPSSAPDRNLKLTWTATDADNDPLTQDIWWSRNNGESWLPLTLNLNAAETTIDTARLAPAESVLLRIRVSDGFNETTETLGPIALDAKPSLDAIAPIRLADARINEGRIVRIPVRNAGPGTLRITAVESANAALTYTGQAIAIPAGESVEIPLLFQPTAPGSFSLSISLKTNDPARPVVQLPVEGIVYQQRGPTATLSVTALDFGSATGTADRSLRITNTGNAPLNIANISTGSTQVFRLTGANTLSINPGASADIAVRCTPSSSNFSAGTLTATTNDPVRPSLSVALGCEGSSSALETPTVTVEFGSVPSGQVRTQLVTIRNASSQPIGITGAVFTNAQFRLSNPRLPLTMAPSTSANLELQFAPSVAGVATSTLALNTDNPAISAQMTLRGTGTGNSQANGRLEVDPNQLAFGDVIVNQSRALTLTLRNSGTGPLTITTLASNNPVFAVTSPALPLAILSGTPVDIQIRFNPSSANAYNSVLTISSDSITGSDLLLSLTGSGLPIPATTLSNLSAPIRQDWAARSNLVSFGPDEANLRLVRFDLNGIQLTDTGVTIPPGTQLLPVLDAGSGWSQVRVAKGSIEGYLQFTGQQAQTFDVVPLNPALSTRLILTGLERGSDILLSNLVSETNNISLELRTNNGALIDTPNQILSARASLAQRVEQLFSNAPQGFQGYLSITAAQPLLATRTNNGTTAMEIVPAQPAPPVAARNVVLYAPRIQAGNGWLARLQVVNPTNRDARITIRSASSGGVTVGTPVVETIAAGHAYWREYTQMFNLDGNITWNASLTVESNVAGIVAELSYGNSFARAAYALTETTTRRATIPVNNSSTNLYILNPGSTPAGVSILNLLEGGTYGSGRRITIAAGGYYGGPSGLQASPALRIESDAPVVTHASIQADQVVDFGILPAINLDGGSSVTPPSGTSPRLQVDPASLDFGNVVIGQSRTLSLSIRNGGTATLTVSSVVSSSPRYTVESVLPLTVTPGSTQQLQIRFTPAAAATGAQTATLTVSSNDSLTGPVIVSLTGIGASTELPKVRIDVSPQALDFSDVNSGQIKDLTIQIRNLGVDPMTVTSATVSNSRFQLLSANFPLTVLPSGLSVLQVRFAPAVAGLQAGTLTINSNDTANPAVNVALRGVGVGTAASPRIVVSVTNLEFGPVRIGQLSEHTFEIRNTGVAPLTIQAMTIDSNTYAVGPAAPFTIAPNAIADVGVTFRPRDPGNQPATLRIVSNDPVNSTVVIPITGAGQ